LYYGHLVTSKKILDSIWDLNNVCGLYLQVSLLTGFPAATVTGLGLTGFRFIIINNINEWAIYTILTANATDIIIMLEKHLCNVCLLQTLEMLELTFGSIIIIIIMSCSYSLLFISKVAAPVLPAGYSHIQCPIHAKQIE